MKKIAFILALIMCVLPLCACGDPEARDILDDDGNAIATGYYDGDTLVYEEKVDNNGDVSKRTSYDSKGRVEKIETYTLNTLYLEEEFTYTKTEGSYTCKATRYNNKNAVVSVTETVYEGGKAVSETVTTPSEDEPDVQLCTMKYNDDGTVLLTITSNDKKIRETLEDSEGKVIYDHAFSENGSSAKTFYEKDDVISKIENYNAEGKLFLTTTNTYDGNGVIIRSETHDADGALRDYSTYVYKESKLAAIYKYKADGSILSSIIYDENGKASIHNGSYIPLN